MNQKESTNSKIDEKSVNFVTELLTSRKFKKTIQYFRRDLGVPFNGFDLSLLDEMVYY